MTSAELLWIGLDEKSVVVNYYGKWYVSGFLRICDDVMVVDGVGECMQAAVEDLYRSACEKRELALRRIAADACDKL